MFHDEGEAHRETISHAAERVISGRIFRPEIPAAGGGPSHYLEYGMTAGCMPIFREHGSSFAEPEDLPGVPGRGENRQGGKGAGDRRGCSGHGGLPRDPEQKRRGASAWRRPPGVIRMECLRPLRLRPPPSSRDARRCRCRSRSPCRGTARARPAR